LSDPEVVPNAPQTSRWTFLPTKRGLWLKRLALAWILYTLVGFLVLPAILKWQLRKQLPLLTHRAARVEAVRVNPYALSLGIRGLALTEPDGSTFASFSNFFLNFEAGSSLLHWTWTFKKIQLDSPYGYVAVLTNGQFNFANLLTNAPTSKATKPASPSRLPPPVRVESLVITNGVVAVADFYRAAPFQSRFAPIDLHVADFTTRPRQDSPYEFTATTGESARLNWAGGLTLVPPASAGKFELVGIDLKKYATYLGEFTQLGVRDGKVSVSATYRFALSTNGVDLTLTNGTVLLTNLQVYAPDATNSLVSIPHVAVHGAVANLRQRTAKVASVETIGGSILARRFRDGTLELLQLAASPTNRAPSILNPPVTTNAPATPVASSTPWSVLVNTIAVKDYAVHVNDEQPPTPAHIVADQVELTMKDLSLAPNARVSVQLSARVNNTGSVKLGTQGTLLPLALDTDLDINAIDLRPFQPYVEQQQLKLAFTSGDVSTKGSARFALEGTNPPAMKFTGDVALNNIAIVDKIAFEDFARSKQVALSGIDFVLAPMSVKVRELACDEVMTSVVVSTNKQLTALAVLPAKTNTVAVAGQPPSAPNRSAPESLLPFPVQLDRLALTNASIRFTDLSLQPNCHFAVEQFSGTVLGLSSELNTAADVDITGRVNEGAPFALAGKINPLTRDLIVDLVISNRNTELTGFTPYMEKFGGYPLLKGKLTLGLKYQIKQQALEAQNVVFIDQLTLGQRNNSPEATKLPVKLGVALLKDRNGRIELDVPVKGRLDDPKFAVWPIARHVVENLLLKAATSPFTLLGALVGGGEELSFVDFTPGQSTMKETEMVKVEKLAKALYERPALNLEIAGSADETLDRAALAWLKLEHELKAARMAELAGRTDAPASAEEIQLAPRDYARLLKANYKKTFNRAQPLPATTTNATTGAITNALPAITRSETLKGAAALMIHDVSKPAATTAKAPVATENSRATTRPGSFPPLAADDELLAQMESALHAGMDVTANDLRALMQSRAEHVQRALLKTEKVRAERLFILTPKSVDAGAKAQSRVTLSLN
jgi:hypothetical protein